MVTTNLLRIVLNGDKNAGMKKTTERTEMTRL